VQISATRDRVWEIVSDLDKEPEFWRGTRSVRNVSRDGNRVVREVTIAFKNKRCMQEVTLEPKSRVHARFTEGIIQGEKSITVSEDGGLTVLSARWDIVLTGMMGVFSGMIKKHIQSGTEQALRSIKEVAER
jgi:carbon monoxide dehydrogenase subunit G